jgi:repressor LexA
MIAARISNITPCMGCPFARGPLPLTLRQSQLLAFVASSIDARGVAPTFKEMMEHLGVRSADTVNQIVWRLQRAGYLLRRTAAVRGLRLSPHGVDWWYEAKKRRIRSASRTRRAQMIVRRRQAS